MHAAMSRKDCFSSSVSSLPPSSGSAMSIHFWQADWAASICSSESPSPFIRTPSPGVGSGMSTPCSRMHSANFSIASSGSRSASSSPEGDAEEAPAASGRAESSSPEPLPQAADRPSRTVIAVAARTRRRTVLVWWLVVMRPLQPVGRSVNVG